ncbi:MAG: carbamoyl phosphate synthase small subunit [Clostridia bacterium]|nr:carbamoyl phosphate synthase small subunit [Clostridia bacterium]
MKKAYLVLENGCVFEGTPFGKEADVTAEVVFTTGMTGYLETLTDKSYHGQIVVQTFPLIGNYGVISADFEGEVIAPCAYIVKEWCEKPSNFRSEGDLGTFFKERGVVGLSGIDTRTLVTMIREHGVMNGMITSDPARADMEKIKAYSVKNSVESVSTKEPYEEKCENAKYKVALFDFGLKKNIARSLNARGCDVFVLPYNTKPETVKKMGIDGIMLSNGPGDPADNTEIIKNLKEISTFGIPTFGICLGHQLLALSHGFKTQKLKYGHRGANQPAKDLTTGKVYITSQNHGYAVVSESIDPAVAAELFVNATDGTCEGIEYKDAPAFSVQFHPEACAGPRDTEFLFDKFIKLMEVNKNASR